MPRAIRLWPVAALLAVVSACGAPDLSAVVHFRNHTATALAINVSSGAFSVSQALTPCGGELSITVPPPPADDPRVLMGAIQDQFLDTIVDNGEADDGTDLSDRFWPNSALVWSTGEINDLPHWITFRPGEVDLATIQPSEASPSICEPWPPEG